SYRPNGLSLSPRRPMTIRTIHQNRGVARRLLPALLLVLALVAAGTAGARQASPSPLTTKLARALAVGGLGGAQSAALAVDLQTGEVLFRRQSYAALEPASN